MDRSRRDLLTGTLGMVAAAPLATAADPAPGFLAWDFLQPGDTVAVIAPSSPPSDPERSYAAIRAYFAQSPYGLQVDIPDGLVQPTEPLHAANTASERARFIEQALHSPAKAVWAILGGGWSTELLPLLSRMRRPRQVKPLIGYSDTTSLHVFFNQAWGWPSLHGVVLGANGDILPDTSWNKTALSATLDVLTGARPWLDYALRPLNRQAAEPAILDGLRVLGGNGLLLSATQGTDDFALDTRGALVFIESVALNPGMLSRMLDGFSYSPLLRRAAAVMFGSWIETGGTPNPADVELQFDYIQRRFANAMQALGIPVLRAQDIFGHGPVNLPLPLNTRARLELGASARLRVSANGAG